MKLVNNCCPELIPQFSGGWRTTWQYMPEAVRCVTIACNARPCLSRWQWTQLHNFTTVLQGRSRFGTFCDNVHHMLGCRLSCIRLYLARSGSRFMRVRHKFSSRCRILFLTICFQQSFEGKLWGHIKLWRTSCNLYVFTKHQMSGIKTQLAKRFDKIGLV
jgi:hypothetical protein